MSFGICLIYAHFLEYLSTSSDRLHETRPDFAHLPQVITELHLVEKEGHQEVSLKSFLKEFQKFKT